MLNADDPLIADLGRERAGVRATRTTAASDGGVVYFGVDDDSLALPAWRTPPTRSTAAAAAPRTCTTPSTSATSATTAARPAVRRPAPAVLASDRDPRWRALSALSAAARPPARPRSSSRCPGLYNVYNALAAAALARALEIPLSEIVAGLQSGHGGVRASGDRDDRRARPPPQDCGSCSSRTRRAPTRCCARSRWSPGEHDLLGVLNDNIADGRDVSWIWDADFELLAGRVRRVTCAGTRAAELALRLKYAGIEREPHRGRRRPLPGADGAAADRPGEANGRAPLYVLPTYTAMLALRELLVRAGRRAAHGAEPGGRATQRAAGVRALPGPDEHLRRPRQPARARAPLRVARDRLRADREWPGRAARPRWHTTSSTSAAARTATSDCAREDLLADQARGPARGRRARRGVPRRLRRLPAARPLLRARRRGDRGGRPARRAHRARARTAADRQRRDRGLARRRHDRGPAGHGPGHGPRVLAGFENHGGRTHLGADVDPAGAGAQGPRQRWALAA